MHRRVATCSPIRAGRASITPDQYFKSQAEMAEAFADLPGALANSVAIAQRCNLTIPVGKNYLPDFPTPAGVTLDDHLRSEAGVGIRTAARDPLSRIRRRARRSAPNIVARLDFETKTIVQMGFAGYFLIVADFINWAKRNGVPVGPGRGSGAGSLVAFALGITDLDPLRYGLAVRALAQSRADFDAGPRHRLLPERARSRHRLREEEVRRRIRFADRDVRHDGRRRRRSATWAACSICRTLFCDGIAKLIPFQPGKQVTLREARAMEPLLAEREQKEEEVRELLALAESLEGLTRNVGMHAGGVLIAPGKLTDFCPLYTQAGSDALVSQFDKDDVEAVGLVKFDFLGLTTLTILDWTLRYIKRLDPASDLRLETLPLDDRATYDIFKAGQYGRRVPVRIARNARPDETGAADALRGHHRAGGAVPARSDGAHPDLHGAQDAGASASTIPIRGSSRFSVRRTA